MNRAISLILHTQVLWNITLWGDEIFGRHALLSRGWGSTDKLCITPILTAAGPTGVDHHSAGFAIRHRCADANVPVEVRLLPLQL